VEGRANGLSKERKRIRIKVSASQSTKEMRKQKCDKVGSERAGSVVV
jgi:hypothetical protein